MHINVKEWEWTKISMALALILALSFFVFKSPNKQNFVPKAPAVTLQFIPLPMVINEMQKDNLLYELLVKKKEAQLTLANVNLDLEPIFITSMPLKNLSIDFVYNAKSNRVEFRGQSTSLRPIRLAGYYALTPKNNIRYYITIKDRDKDYIIDATYSPSYLDNESEHAEMVNGSFEVTSRDMLKTFFNFGGDSSLSIKGSFIKKDNFLDIKDLYLKANDLEASAKATLDGKVLNLDMALNEINLDKILTHMPDGYINKILSESLKKLDGLTMKGNINCSKVTINNTELRSIAAVLAKEKENQILKVSDIKFSLPDHSIFTSSITIFPINSMLGAQGSFELSGTKAGLLSKFLSLGDYSGANFVSVSSKFESGPNSIDFQELKISEASYAVTGDLHFSKYSSSKMLRGNLLLDSYNFQEPSFIHYMINKNNLLYKNYEASLDESKKEKFLKDITVKFSNLQTSTSVVKSLSARYIETPNSIGFEYIKADDPKFNLQSSIKFESSKSGANLAMKFEGNRVDMDIFYDIVVRPLIYNGSDALSFPKFNQATGNVILNLKNPDKKAYISEVNCSANLNEQIITTNNCLVNLFDSQMTLNGKFKLGETTGYDVSFSNSNTKISKLVRYLTGQSKKITGAGEAHISGTVSSNGFSTLDEMMKLASGTIKLQSKFIGLTDIDLKSLIYKYGTIKNVAARRGKKATEFYNLNGDFDLSNGKLESNNISFTTKDNIHGKTNVSYGLADKNTNGFLSLAYFDSNGKIDGFNISFYGDIRNLKTKLGTSN